MAVPKILRRIISITLVVVCSALVAVITPLVLPILALIDIFHPRLTLARGCMAILLFLLSELIGLILAFGLYVARIVADIPEKTWVLWNFSLQIFWAKLLFRSFTALFSVKVRVEGDEALAEGNFLAFMRHSSVVDTILPIIVISAPHAVLLRFVMKKELLWDPCVDVGGNRLRNYFLDRSNKEEKELQGLTGLLNDLSLTEGVLFYPEGTRFSPKKRQRAITSLVAKGRAWEAEAAQSLRNVMLPRLRGSLALLKANTHSDIVFICHRGLECLTSLKHLFVSPLLRGKIDVWCWRVPFASLPEREEQMKEFLLNEWRKMDLLLADQPPVPAAAELPPPL